MFGCEQSPRITCTWLRKTGFSIFIRSKNCNTKKQKPPTQKKLKPGTFQYFLKLFCVGYLETGNPEGTLRPRGIHNLVMTRYRILNDLKFIEKYSKKIAKTVEN